MNYSSDRFVTIWIWHVSLFWWCDSIFWTHRSDFVFSYSVAHSEGIFEFDLRLNWYPCSNPHWSCEASWVSLSQWLFLSHTYLTGLLWGQKKGEKGGIKMQKKNQCKFAEFIQHLIQHFSLNVWGYFHAVVLFKCKGCLALSMTTRRALGCCYRSWPCVRPKSQARSCSVDMMCHYSAFVLGSCNHRLPQGFLQGLQFLSRTLQSMLTDHC